MTETLFRKEKYMNEITIVDLLFEDAYFSLRNAEERLSRNPFDIETLIEKHDVINFLRKPEVVALQDTVEKIVPNHWAAIKV